MSARVAIDMPRETAADLAEALGRGYVALDEKANDLRASSKILEAGKTRAAGRELLRFAAALTAGYEALR